MPKTRRDLVYLLFPKKIGLFETINNNVDYVQLRDGLFASCPEFPDRDSLYEHVARTEVRDAPITYLEFGVWRGESIARWTTLNHHPDSRFVGFDTFTGLPEDWMKDCPKGTFSVEGQTPNIPDSRVSFVKGMFQDTLVLFLDSNELRGRLVVHIDCDLYSSTLYVLGSLDHRLTAGSLVMFDDFYSLNHEFKAFCDHQKAFMRHWQAIGKTANCGKVAVRCVTATEAVGGVP